MPVYEYEAITKSGKKARGVIDADSPVAARRKVREQELYPTKIQEGFTKSEKEPTVRGFSRISLRDVAMTTRQLAVLLQAGMSLGEALAALIEQTSNSRLRKNLYSVRDKVNEGVSLADALAAHPKVFSPLYVNMVSAGETGGVLEQVLMRLSDILERQVELKNRVGFALMYPAVMSVIGLSVIAFLMVVIVPRITKMFIDQKRELPAITQILITVCGFVGTYWWAIVLAAAGLYVLWRVWVSRADGRRRWDAFKLRLPLFGQLYIKLICARLSRTLGTMLHSGLTMLTALEVVKSVLGNRVIEDLMDDVKADVRRGRELSVTLKEAGLFPPLLIHMTELGQRSGELESMMLKIADTYDSEVQVAADAIVRLLEPLMVVVMGCFVGLLVISILLPIFQMTSGI